MQRRRVLIVDDDPSFRRLAQECLSGEPDIEVVGETMGGADAFAQARELKPDLILIDLRMPGLHGIDIVRQIKSEAPEIDIIVWNVFDLAEYREAALASGARGYVVKKSLFETLVPAIRAACLDGHDGNEGNR